MAETAFFAPLAWVDSAWQADVRLVAQDGVWHSIEPHAQATGATVLDGLVLPGIVNAHSHAFQRAMAGMAEHRSSLSDHANDDFWSWREQMYRVAQRITPNQLEAVATQLYTELLAGGYTQVCEFHYLHNDTDGKPYADAAELGMAIVRAAQNTGIGLTLLPTLYMHAGFDSPALRHEQRRFASTPDGVLRLAGCINGLHLPGINAGIAIHSLRAVGASALRDATRAANAQALPVHIHISEQTQEVDDCVRLNGYRPIELLLAQAEVNKNWNLVHATHASAEELKALRRCQANIVLCPSTEANLGDGVFDLPAWLRLGGNWAVGSDSHVTRQWAEELRLLEYSQRFALRQRNVAAKHALQSSTAAALLQGAVAGGSGACGAALRGLAVGQRADFCVFAQTESALAGIPQAQMLDALVFSSPTGPAVQTAVAGQLLRRKAPQTTAMATGTFSATMAALWGT